MKNIYLIETDKPSRFYKSKITQNLFISDALSFSCDGTYNQHLYITSDEKIKEGDWCLSKLNEIILFGKNYTEQLYKKIVLTTDQDLINNGVQDIDDDFLQWFVKNPSYEKVEVKKWSSLAECGYSYHITIPKEEQKQHLADIMNTPLGQEVEHSDQVEETLEEIKNPIGDFIFKNAVSTLCFDGAYYHYSEVCKLLRLQEERMYSEKEVLHILFKHTIELFKENPCTLVEFFEQFKKQ